MGAAYGFLFLGVALLFSFFLLNTSKPGAGRTLLAGATVILAVLALALLPRLDGAGGGAAEAPYFPGGVLLAFAVLGLAALMDEFGGGRKK